MDARSYYDSVTSIDIGAVSRELFAGRITDESAQRLHVDCPHHASESRRSLHVDLGKGLWHCFGCQVGGDVIQLVEFVRTGQITKGVTGVMTDSHREARDWLGASIGLPPMRQAGLSTEEIARLEERRVESERVFSALTILVEIYHQNLLDSPEVLALIEKQWGFGIRVVKDFKIGWANAPDAVAQLKARGVDERTALSTGAFVIDSQEHILPFFQKRIVFPYISRGRVVYAIGRKTPWTDDRDRAKYKKLQTHHPELRKYISPVIESTIFGEDILASRPKNVSITEGITDAIATIAQGFPCISPVTVGFKKDDIDGLVKRLRGTSRVYIIQDNEFSGIGLKGSLLSARIMADAGIDALVGLIPVPPDQARARKELDELMGQDLAIQIRNADPGKRAKLLDQELAEDKRERGRELREASKVDLCQWWQTDGTPEAYQEILNSARTVMEVAIDSAPIVVGEKGKQVEAVLPILTEIGLHQPAARDDLLRRLKGTINVSLSILRAESAQLARKQKEKEREENKDTKTPGVLAALADGAQGSLKEMLSKMVQAAQANQQPVSWERMGIEAFEWFRGNGAIFFRNYDGTPFMYFDSRVYAMNGAGGQKQMFEGFMFKHSGFVPVSAGARTFFSVLRSLAVERGDVRSLPTWVQTFVDDKTIYVNLNNAESEVVAIRPDGIVVNSNGKNAHRAILCGTSKFEPIVIPEKNDHMRLEDRWRTLIGDFLATDELSRKAIFTWTCIFPMVEYVGTRPMMRFEGDPGSGKTWAAKMLTTLIFGDDQQKKATTAANYVDASANPLVALDNVEMSNVTQDLIDFLLTVVTGIRREKRKGNSDTDTVSERPVSLILSTGVEPLGGDLAEIMSRSIVIPFVNARQTRSIVEREILARIKENRNSLMAMIFSRCAAILNLIDERDALSRVMTAITTAMGAHSKRRCNEYLALMYLVDIAVQPESRIESMLDEITPSFGAMLTCINEESEAVSRESSSIGVALSALFTTIRSGGSKAADEHGIETNDICTKIIDVAPQELFIALRTVARVKNINFGYSNAKQFGRRLALEIEGLGMEGFGITHRIGRARRKFYSITRHKLEPETGTVENVPWAGEAGIVNDPHDDQYGAEPLF